MNKCCLGIVGVLMVATACLGQTNKTTGRKGNVGGSPTERHVVLMSGTNINAELQKTLDVNKAQVGDEVVLRTSQAIRQDGEIVIPKGSNLVGRVTEVQRRTKENAMSRISMVFERVESKFLSLPLNATVVSITDARANAAVGDSLATDLSGSSQTMASSTRGNSGGGLLGGVGTTVGGLLNTTTQTVGGVTNTAAHTLGTTTQTVGQTFNGLHISADASGSATSSTTLSTQDRKLRIDKGANFQLRVAN